MVSYTVQLCIQKSDLTLIYRDWILEFGAANRFSYWKIRNKLLLTIHLTAPDVVCRNDRVRDVHIRVCI